MTLPSIGRAYLDAYTRKDVAALVDCIAEAVVFENVANARPSLRIEGRDAFAELAHQAAALCASRHRAVRSAVVDGDRVALEIEWTGMPAVDLGTTKAGVEVTLRGATFTIADGKPVRIVDLS